MDRRWLARKLSRTALCAAASLALCAAAVAAPVAIWTQHNDNARTGQNNLETQLNVGNVSKNTFGKLFSYPVDDQMYAQPLYIPSLTMPADNQAHNVVFVATVNNTLYAFDADNPASNGGLPLWTRNLTPAGARPPNNRDINGYNDFSGNMGTVGTPVIDAAAGTMYIVSRHMILATGVFVQQLHAINIRTGAERANSPVAINATYTADNVQTTFDGLLENQRVPLLLLNGVVYIAWASHGDTSPYHGWFMGYRTSDLSRVALWSTTPSGDMASIWQSGQGLTVDGSGNIYFITGNGSFDGANNFGESVVKLSTNPATGAVALADFFTPSNWNDLNGADADFGCGGLLGIPGTKMVVGGGKDGRLFLLNTDNLGQVNNVDRAVQVFQASMPATGQSGELHGTPAYWKNASGQYIYVWGENDYLRQFQFTNGVDANHGSFNTTAKSHSPYRAPLYNGGSPGGFLSVTSNNAAAGTGIVWASTPYNDNANQQTVAGILSAFDASDVSRVLWTSKDFPSRDDVGRFAKFVAPVITNGKVYIPSWGDGAGGPNKLSVYGLLPTQSGGTGLAVSYYNDPANSVYPLTNPFTSAPVVTRVDPTVDFDWGNDSPDPAVNVDQFSAQWTGAVVPRYSENYTFHLNSDNGRRLWVDGQLIIDKWLDNFGIDYVGQITLQAGRRYSIRIDYFEDNGGANIKLRWESPSQTLQVIPQSQLYPVLVPPPPTLTQMTLAATTINAGSSTTGLVTLSGSSDSDVVVALGGNSNAISVPTSVTVPANATTASFTVMSHPGFAVNSAPVTATLNDVVKRATLNVVVPVTLTGLTITPNPVTAGASATGKVTFSVAPSAGLWVVLTSSNGAAAHVYAGVMVRAGATSATFPITTRSGSAATSTITATMRGVSKQATLNIVVSAARVSGPKHARLKPAAH